MPIVCAAPQPTAAACTGNLHCFARWDAIRPAHGGHRLRAAGWHAGTNKKHDTGSWQRARELTGWRAVRLKPLPLLLQTCAGRGNPPNAFLYPACSKRAEHICAEEERREAGEPGLRFQGPSPPPPVPPRAPPPSSSRHLHTATEERARASAAPVRCRALLATCKRAHSCAERPARHRPGDRSTIDRARGGVPSRAWRGGRALRWTDLRQLRPPPCSIVGILPFKILFFREGSSNGPLLLLLALRSKGRVGGRSGGAWDTMTGVGMGSA